MAKAKQLTVWTESTPAQLGRIARALGDARVNITAFTCGSQPGDCPLRLQVNQHAKAKKVLQDLGLRITEEEVLRVSVADKPGTLAEIGARLGQAAINIEYGYGAVAEKSRRADLVFGVSDLDGAQRALKGLK
ncbi:MAG TPA: ACT domain-containing protein [Terriglobia bacterium]